MADEAAWIGDEVTIRATVENVGDADGSTADLSVDGTVVERRSVDLPAGERTTVDFTRVLEEPGTATVAVGDAGTEVAVGSDASPTGGSVAGVGAVVGVVALLLGHGVPAAGVATDDRRYLSPYTGNRPTRRSFQVDIVASDARQTPAHPGFVAPL